MLSFSGIQFSIRNTDDLWQREKTTMWKTTHGSLKLLPGTQVISTHISLAGENHMTTPVFNRAGVSSHRTGTSSKWGGIPTGRKGTSCLMPIPCITMLSFTHVNMSFHCPKYIVHLMKLIITNQKAFYMENTTYMHHVYIL